MVRSSRPPAWPSENQELLLKAALCPAGEAATAWERWKRTVPRRVGTLPMDAAQLESLTEPQAASLLPMVYRNLADCALAGDERAALQRRYRTTYAQNRLLLSELDRALDVLGRRGIEPLVLKGAALAPLYYGDLGTRVLGDLDVAVPVDRFTEAASVLRESGYSGPLPSDFDPRFHHSVPLAHDRGPILDLHCHILSVPSAFVADGLLRRGSRPVRISESVTRTLSATDHLIHACVHGVRFWWGPPHLRWAADAITLMRRASEPIDWDRVGFVAELTGVGPQLLTGLSYLAWAFGFTVPEELPERLRRARGGLASRTLQRLYLRPHRESRTRWAITKWARYTVAVAADPPRSRRWSLTGLLSYSLKTRRPWRRFVPWLAQSACRLVSHTGPDD